MLQAKRLVATLFATMLMAVGFAAPASAQPLVDVDIRNVLNNNTVQITVPVNAAVAICADVDVNAAVLRAAIEDEDAVTTFNCDARANQEVTIRA